MEEIEYCDAERDFSHYSMFSLECSRDLFLNRDEFDVSQEVVDEWVAEVDGKWFPELARVDAIAPLTPIEERFAELVSTWRDETENVSSLTRIVSHHSYQSIIDLGKNGENVVPLILKEFFGNGGYWSTALRAITGENPVLEQHVGDPKLVREDWLRWGRQNGCL